MLQLGANVALRISLHQCFFSFRLIQIPLLVDEGCTLECDQQPLLIEFAIFHAQPTTFPNNEYWCRPE